MFGMAAEARKAKELEAEKEISRLREENARLSARVEEIQALYQSSTLRRARYHTLLCQIGRMIQEME
jgi:uncharacterized protein YlxW (UPF0749 family)